MIYLNKILLLFALKLFLEENNIIFEMGAYVIANVWAYVIMD